MLSPTHLGIGLASAVYLNSLPDAPHFSVIDFVALSIGAIAPDIDTGEGAIAKPSEVVGKWLPKGPKVYIDTVFGGLSKGIATLFGHRTVFHWPLIGFALIYFGDAIETPWVSWFGWGYLMHILADFFTPGGVPIFGPVFWKSIGIPAIETGSFRELILCFVIWIYVIFEGFYQLPDETKGWLEIYGDATIAGIEKAHVKTYIHKFLNYDEESQKPSE